MSVVTKDTIQPSSGQALTIKDEGGTASITVATNGEATFAENIKITANKGINFSAYGSEDSDSATTISSNLLDDYEEGTWTPTLLDGGCTGTCYYIKIGNSITVYGKITHSSDGSTGTGVTITNPPFNISGSSPNHIFPGQAECTVDLVDTGDTSSYFYINADANQMVLSGYPSHSGANSSRWSSGDFILFNCTYITE